MSEELITKDQCYVQSTCKKFKRNECNDLICRRLFKIDYLFNESLLTEKQRQNVTLLLDANRIDEEKYRELSLYKDDIVENVQNGKSLYIYSSIPGNGKTSWAVKLLQSYVLKIWGASELKCCALFISVPKFFLELKSNISKKSDYIEHINNNILDADLVIWDDIGTKSATEFEHEHLISLIDSRILEGKANIFTSNISPNQLSTLVGDRLASRVVNNSLPIEFKGQDKRGLNK